MEVNQAYCPGNTEAVKDNWMWTGLGGQPYPSAMVISVAGARGKQDGYEGICEGGLDRA